MTTFRAKLWTGVGAALLVAATGCSEKDAGKSSAIAASAAAPSSGPVEAVGEGGSEGGAQGAFESIPAASKVALRLGQLKGFVLIALRQTDGPDAGGVLLSQGIQESFDRSPNVYTAAGVDEAILRKAAKTGAPADLKAALANIEAAEAKAGGDRLAVVKGLAEIASGLYGEAVKPGSVDPIDYQHSLGAAMAAQTVLEREVGKDPRAATAMPEMKKFVALWPKLSAPETPTPAAQVAAQASRLELELS